MSPRSTAAAVAVALAAASMLATNIADAADAAANRTVMVWLSDGVGGVDEKGYTELVDFIVSHNNAINAVSVEGLYTFASDGSVKANATAVQLHQQWAQRGMKTFPILGCSELAWARKAFQNVEAFTATLVNEITKYGFDGYNIDIEPATNVSDPSSATNPTDDDAAQFAKFLTHLADAMHALDPPRTITVDTMSVVGACRSTYHYPKNLEPCPWIRRFWNFQMLAESTLDKALTMDTYTQNDTEFPLDMLYNQWYFPLDRLGIGLCPWCWVNGGMTGGVPPTQEELHSRFQSIYADGVLELDLWELGANSTLQAVWDPWWPYLEAFMAGAPPPKPKAT